MITIFDWFGYNVPYEERYRMIKDAGFDGVLLWWSDEFGADYKRNPELAHRAGLFVENIHTSFEKINDFWLDNLSGEELTSYFLQCVDDCHDYEIPTMIIHLTSGENPPPANKLCVNRLRKILERAERKCVNVAVENMRKSEYLEYVFERIDSDRLVFCFDSGHQNAYSQSIDLLSLYGNRLAALHLHDNDGKEDQHRMPFDGGIDWNALMKKLTDIDYAGPTALEVERMGYEHVTDPRGFLAIAFDRAKRLGEIRKVSSEAK